MTPRFFATQRHTCALLVRSPPFALSVHVGAQRPGEMFVHHAADVTLVIGEEDAARCQVLCLRGLLLLLGPFLWPGSRRRVGGRGRGSTRRGRGGS